MSDAELISVSFKFHDGSVKKIEVPVGTDILDAAHNNGIPLEGACEKSLACSTCHVIFEKEDFDKLPEPSEDEEDMLDLAFALTETSRLGCQIILTKEMNGIVVAVPASTRNYNA